MAGFATRLYGDERGVILSAEIVLIMTVGILSMIVGLHVVSQAVTCEFNDLASAFSNLRQSYTFAGFTGRGCCKTKSFVVGSTFSDVGRCNQVASTSADVVSCGPRVVRCEKAVAPTPAPVGPPAEAPCVCEAPPVDRPCVPDAVQQVDCERLKCLVRELCREVAAESGCPQRPLDSHPRMPAGLEPPLEKRQPGHEVPHRSQ